MFNGALSVHAFNMTLEIMGSWFNNGHVPVACSNRLRLHGSPSNQQNVRSVRRPLRTQCWHHCIPPRSEEHTSELQSQSNLVCRLLLEKKKKPPIASGLQSQNVQVTSMTVNI